MCGDKLGVLQVSIVFEVIRDSGGTEGVVANIASQSGLNSPPLDHAKGIGPMEASFG
jgi:hypothetical protein